VVDKKGIEKPVLKMAQEILELARPRARPSCSRWTTSSSRSSRRAPPRGWSRSSRTAGWASTSARRPAGSLREKIAAAKTALWNGPMGVFEMKGFDEGTARRRPRLRRGHRPGRGHHRRRRRLGGGGPSARLRRQGHPRVDRRRRGPRDVRGQVPPRHRRPRPPRVNPRRGDRGRGDGAAKRPAAAVLQGVRGALVTSSSGSGSMISSTRRLRSAISGWSSPKSGSTTPRPA
jgi:hypothetical protein